MTGPSLDLDALREKAESVIEHPSAATFPPEVMDAVLALVDEQRRENERLREGLSKLRDYGALGDEFVRMLAETALAGSPSEKETTDA